MEYFFKRSWSKYNIGLMIEREDGDIIEEIVVEDIQNKTVEEIKEKLVEVHAIYKTDTLTEI